MQLFCFSNFILVVDFYALVALFFRWVRYYSWKGHVASWNTFHCIAVSIFLFKLVLIFLLINSYFSQPYPNFWSSFLEIVAKGDEYHAFRKTATQQWDSVKSCYQKVRCLCAFILEWIVIVTCWRENTVLQAALAYSNGSRGYAAYLSDQVFYTLENILSIEFFIFLWHFYIFSRCLKACMYHDFPCKSSWCNVVNKFTVFFRKDYLNVWW